MHITYLAVFLASQLLFTTDAHSAQPHIIFYLADDLGWNDLSYHGSTQIPTPNIDNLCYDGVILNDYYTLPMCTPSRAALQTGRYPIRYGFQSGVLKSDEPRCLPLNETILPQYLKQLGYQTAMVGKWHLGFAANACLPHRRGFDSFVGYLHGESDYWDRSGIAGDMYGFDIASNDGHPDDTFGIYGTELWTQHAINVLKKSDPAKPLFLFVSEQAVHTGLEWQPLTAPSRYFTSVINRIGDARRRTFGAMVTAMDEAVGHVVAALKQFGFYDNAIIVFASDNGAAVNGLGRSVGNNFPLRGGKRTLFEGGVRVAACIHSPSHLPPSAAGTVSHQLMHVVDWMPTLLAAAGAPASLYVATTIDGVNMWNALRAGAGQPRKEVLLNYDPEAMQSALRLGEYKLLVGPSTNNKYSSWYVPLSAAYSDYSFWNQSANTSASRADSLLAQRQPVKVQCGNSAPVTCDLRTGPCLFNVVDDPCELVNLAASEADRLHELTAILQRYAAQAAPAGNTPCTDVADPKHYSGFWGPYLTTEQLLQVMNRQQSASSTIDCNAACVSQVNRCSSIPPVENALHNGTSADQNALVTFTCRRGFRLRGAATITCSASGQWMPAVPYCLRSNLT